MRTALRSRAQIATPDLSTAGGAPRSRNAADTLPLLATPTSESELLARARRLAGRTLGELAAEVGVTAPLDLRRAKGFPGQLVERLLGASAGSRAEPDFPALGVELKTLPVDHQGRPRESTFVCTIDPATLGRADWDGSWVQRKLARVLWVPIEGDRALPVPTRHVGEPLLWSPTAEEVDALRCDWEELAGRIARGDAESIDGRMGRCLQVRPKAAHSRARRRGVDEDGGSYAALPRGFYLRATFTAEILRRNYALPCA